MKAKLLINLVFFLVIGSISFAQSPVIKLPLIVSDDAGSQKELYFGLDPSATDTLDKSLGEQELPPFPPAGIFEVRFIGNEISLPKLGLGAYNDFRQGQADLDSTIIHELQYQVGSGSKIIIKWNLPKGITGLLQDLFSGIVINKPMAKMDSLIVDNPGALFKLKMFISYTGIPFTPLLVSPVDRAENIAVDTMLVWKASVGTVLYSLQVAKDSAFTNLVIDQPAISDTSFQVASLLYLTTYFWRVSATNDNGSSDWSEVWQFTTARETAVGHQYIGSPFEYGLDQNYPNPFNPATTIRFSIPELTKVSLKVYDLLGREIVTLINREMEPGEYHLIFKANELPTGIYSYRLDTGQFVKQRRMILVK